MNQGEKHMQYFEQTTPEAQGIPSGALDRLLTKLQELDSVHSIMLLRHGKLCLQAWSKPFTPEDYHSLFSLSKSFVSTAIAFAEAEKLLALDDTLLSFFPEYEADVTDDRMRKVILRDLLRMASGHASCATPAMFNEPDGDWARGFIASKLDCEPGTLFAYNSAATYMLAAVIHKVAKANVREYLLPRLFIPLDIEPGPWECSPQSINEGGWGFNLKTEDLAKFAQLLLQKGVWNGKQLLPWGYFEAATAKQIDNSMNTNPDWRLGYGYQFWQCQHGYRGDGASGQYVIVMPEEDIAIAITSGVPDMQRILTYIWDEVVPALSDAALPEDAQALEDLNRKAAEWSLPVEVSEVEAAGADAEWSVDANSACISKISVNFLDNKVRIVFTTAKGTETVTAGFGFYEPNPAPLKLCDVYPRNILACAAWVKRDLLKIRICCRNASFKDMLYIDFSTRIITFETSFSTFRQSYLPANLNPLK